MQNESDESWTEEELIAAIDSEPNYDREYEKQKDSATRNIWGAFQDSATSIAQLYRDRSGFHDPGSLWLPFQTAAGTVTTLYKESCDGIKRTNDLAVQCGYQRRTREIAEWARSKKRRYIRREDLLAYLGGKPPPSFRRLSPKPESSYHIHSNSNHSHHHNNSSILIGLNHNSNNAESNDLHTFKEALVRKPRGPELYAFVANEIARHCKRPASPSDVNMDIQNYCNKRQRFM